jgi:beta-glucosidase
LTAAVNNGTLDEARVSDMATRLVASWYQMGQNVSYMVVDDYSYNNFF